MNKKGIVYACSHPKWMEETVRSAFSFARLMPELAREFYAPEELLREFPLPEGTFTKIVSLKSTQVKHRPRFESFLLTELDSALFLDGDTKLIRPIPEVFDLLEHFDLGLTIAPQLHGRASMSNEVMSVLPKVSYALPEYNGGFILAKVNEPFRAFIRQWLELFEKCIKVGLTMDQASLRVAAALSGLRIAVLPNNYNFRAIVKQVVVGEVRLLHAHAELDEIEKYINKEVSFRFYQPSEKIVHGFYPKGLVPQKR
ncbi:MAG: hypothetical protein JNM45_15745 [Rhizobiales bacterium]|nr:hypothetical protein [Hyphomicrobiales bacterium]